MEENAGLARETRELRASIASFGGEAAAIADDMRAQVDDMLRKGIDEEQIRGMIDLVDKLDSTDRAVAIQVNHNYGGQFNNHGSQIAAQGQGAVASNTTQSQDQRSIGVDASALKVELDAIKQDLLASAVSAADYQRVSVVQAAVDSAAEDEGSEIVMHLRGAGTWLLETARRLGLPVAELAIKRALGLES